MKRNLLILVAIGALLALIIFGFFQSNTTPTDEPVDSQPDTDPLDDALSFYNQWLDAAQSTTTDPYAAGVLDSTILTDNARSQIESARDQNPALDPVLCRSDVPERVGGKLTYQLDDEAQLIVLGRGGEVASADQAMVTLLVSDGQWKIDNIECLSGESAPEREFSFDREGFLLKSVPEPYDPDYWHLVFEQDGQMGHLVPLYFDASSTCTALDATESVCSPESFTEATPVEVRGDMTEAGLEVKQLQILPRE